MTILTIDCRKRFPGSHDVWVNGKEESNVFAIYALWNGGPGIVGYFPETDSGRFYITDGQVATAWRLCWSVRIAPKKRRSKVPPRPIPRPAAKKEGRA